MKRALLAAAFFYAGLSALGQITITSQDMFYAIGQYYTTYANGMEYTLMGEIGPGGPGQFWDFTTGPDDLTYQFDYVDINDGGHGADFGAAEFAERKTVVESGEQAWMYLRQTPGMGRWNYGFYDESFSAEDPSVAFEPAMIDFPDPIDYEDTWNANTSFFTQILGLDTRIDYAANAEVDGWGLINLPLIGFGECLRVNELAQYDTYVDMFGDSTYYHIQTDFIRSYYWLMEDHGIATQITSQQMQSEVPDQFTIAAAFVRMFDTNHPSGDLPPEPVDDLQITVGPSSVLLNWTAAPYAEEYRVEYTDAPYGGAWTELGTTSNVYILDFDIVGVEKRFYRVISIN